jgi:hypothetical protein
MRVLVGNRYLFTRVLSRLGEQGIESVVGRYKGGVLVGFDGTIETIERNTG